MGELTGIIIAGFSALSAIISAFLAFLGQREKTSVDALRALSDSKESWWREKFAYLEKENNKISSQLEKMKGEIDVVSKEIRHLRRKFRLSVNYIEIIFPLVPPDKRPPVPPELDEDITLL